MVTLVFLITFFGIGLAVFTVIIIKSILSPKLVTTLNELVKQGKYLQAIKHAKTIIAKEPRNIEAHYLLGLAYMGENKHELALMEFKTCNNIGNFGGYCSEVDFRERIGSLFKRFNQPEEALKEYLILIKLKPNSAQYYQEAGELFEEREKNDKAQDYFRKATELDPKNPEGHLRLGLLLYREKKYLEAKNELDIALRSDSNNYKAHFYLGRIARENHDYVAALLHFEKSQRDPELKIKALIERGGSYMNMNNFERAIAELERAVKISTDESDTETLYARYFLGLCYEKIREIDKAIEHWEKIYIKKPAFKDVAEKLSQYQDLRTDDRVKDYLTSTREDFLEICKGVTEAMDLSTRDINDMPNGCKIIAVENESTKWRNVRKMPKLMWFLRVPELIAESTVRAVHEEMRNLGVARGMIFSSSNFSRKAIEYSESRPIDLINREKLQSLLKNVQFLDKSKKITTGN